ncbi:MAG: SIS domain-containing protein [Eisenbergiella sp.]
MCGIIGFAGNTEAIPVLLDGLERLEYRGYDSAGVAVVSADGNLQVKKSKGRLAVLRDVLAAQNPLSGKIGIGHTRWATHGEPSDVNAHPHVGMVGKYALEKLLRIPAEACLASEFRYSEPILGESSLVIVISQSGETLDSMAALREAKRKGSKVLSIVNVMGSSIARESDYVLYTWAGPEIAVATTKAYTTQMLLLLMLGVCMAKQLNRIENQEYGNIVRGLQELPEKIGVVLNNLDYALGLEGSLKLKEISYIHSESYAAGELKHGTISLIEHGTLVLAMTTEQTEGLIQGQTSEIFLIPRIHPLLQPVLGVIPLQLFAYYIALNRGCDIDKPRNLAKSVTVE